MKYNYKFEVKINDDRDTFNSVLEDLKLYRTTFSDIGYSDKVILSDKPADVLFLISLLIDKDIDFSASIETIETP